MEYAAEPMTLPAWIDGKLAEDVHRLRLLGDWHVGEGAPNLIPYILCPIARAAKGVANHKVIQPSGHGAKVATGCIQHF